MTRSHFASKASTPLISATTKVATILALAVFSATTFGQVHEIVGGRVLDANPQAGSGGSNSPVPGYVPINGNAIIYGQVNGLARFHGTVGSTSPDVFQGNLPSAQINDFARQSASYGPGGVTQAYILPSNIVAGSGGALYSVPINSGFDARLLPGNVISPAAAGYDIASGSLSGAPYRVIDRNAFTAPPETASTPGNALWNPLFSQRVNSGPLLDMQPDNNPSKMIPNPQQELPAPGESPKNPTGNDNSATRPAEANPLGAIRGGVDAERVTGAPMARTGLTGAGAAAGQATALPKDLGTTAMVNSTYRTLQTELDKAQAQAEAADAANGKLPKPVSSPDKTAHTNGASPGEGNTPANGAALANGRTPPSLADEPASRLRAGQKVAPLKTLAEPGPGGKLAPVDVQLKDAETQLKEGKYLDAVDTYQQALVLQPENALALAGRAHAELAAGMYQSAALDLKFLFTKKPEMASVRYSLTDFIPAKRIEDIMADLKKLAAEQKGNTASFLYCYLAYNNNKPQELQDELDRWKIRPAHDEWQAIAAKAWGK